MKLVASEPRQKREFWSIRPDTCMHVRKQRNNQGAQDFMKYWRKTKHPLERHGFLVESGGRVVEERADTRAKSPLTTHTDIS